MSVASERVRAISQGNKVIGIANNNLFSNKKTRGRHIRIRPLASSPLELLPRNKH